MTLVKVVDLRKSGIGTCNRARMWARRHGVDYSRLRKGIPADELLAIDDAHDLVKRVVAEAERRERNGQ